MRLFGTSGIRNVVDRSLIRLTLDIGMALGNTCGGVVVGSDTRTSSDVLKQALLCGILSGGARCHDAGIVPTPTLALASRAFVAGAMVTASHNAPEYNGIKLINPDGSAFDSRQRENVEQLLWDDAVEVISWDKIGGSGLYDGAVEEHIDRIVRDFPHRLKVKVVVDACCGAAAEVTPWLLRKLGCDVIELNCYHSGFFPHDAELNQASMEDLIRVVKEASADVGIAHDGDGDRMMVVDERGRFVSGDKLLVILARGIGARSIVTTVDASMLIDETGFEVRRTKVGDPYVSEELRKGGDFGGEPSGGWVFPGVSLCPDGIYAAAQITAIASEQKLSRLIDSVPSYPILRGSVGGEGVLMMSELEQRLMAMRPLSVIDDDGIKLNFEDGWLLVRGSGTEPKIRVTAEASSEAQARKLYNSGVNTVKNCIKETGKG